MPNWTSNSIRIKGAEADIRAFLDAVKWQDQLFDFNRIIPMPELLKQTGSGFRTIDGEEVTNWYVLNRDDPLPGDDGVRRFTAEENATLAKIGYSNWYDWSVANWGTKWNACRARIEDETSIEHGYAEITFDTAWDAPVPVLLATVKMFPKLTFDCRWRHEDEDAYPNSLDNEIAAADPELLEAAEKVVIRWEKGDLAEAVRELDTAIATAKGRAL